MGYPVESHYFARFFAMNAPDREQLAALSASQHLDMGSWWMPFTANRQFKAKPRLLARAQGMVYESSDGREILDGCAGLWCVNAGHGREEIALAVAQQVRELDFAPAFQMGHPIGFEFASRLTALAPGYDKVFYSNSGSEAVDSALKIALAYHRARGDGTRTRLIGRERGYHGVGFGGILNNRKAFSANMIPGVDHLPHTHNLDHNAFTRGQPAWGAHLANELEQIVALHGAETIAAVIVEPVAGSTGVLVPPQGYLQRLRELCTKHGILLIFDEVITGFGRLGKPFASQVFGVEPDLFTVAKGITNATVPLGAVFCKQAIYDAFMQGPEGSIELFHGYTYSGHPLACAAGLATLDIYQREGLLTRVSSLEKEWEQAMHSLRDLPHVIDIRNIGLIGAIELTPRPGAPAARGYDAMVAAFEAGLLMRVTGDIIALSPPLIVESKHIDQIVTTLRKVLSSLK
jgi:beta-alanine--pyruvate transaminase